MSGKSKKMFVGFVPSHELTLITHSDGKEGSAMILMTNTSDVPVGFKFRTNSQNEITVTPSKGVIQPKEDLKVVLNYFSRGVTPREAEQVQALISPLDDKYKDDHDLRKLFERAKEKDIQEHDFLIGFTSSTALQKAKDDPSSKEPHQAPLLLSRTPSHPKTFRDTSRTKAGLHLTERHSTERHPTERHPTERHPTERHPTEHHPMSPEEAQRAQYQEDWFTNYEQPPHYNLHLTSQNLESESRFPLGRRILRKFSRIGEILGDLSEQSRLLRSSQQWAFAIFWMVLVLLLMLVYFVVATPLWRRRQRRRLHLPGNGNIATATAEEVGETLYENRRGPTLDEYIHKLMS